jgi:hypothetical protein
LAASEDLMLRAVDRPRRANEGMAQRFASAAEFSAARQKARAGLKKLREHAFGARSYIRSAGELEVARIGADVVVPWCERCEALLEAARFEVVQDLALASDNAPADYWAWLFTRNDSSLQFLDDLGVVDLERNPFSSRWSAKPIWRWSDVVPVYEKPNFWHWSDVGSIYARIRFRELKAPDEYELDLHSQGLYAVVNGVKDRQRRPWTHFGALTTNAEKLTMLPDQIEILSIDVLDPTTGAYRRLPLQCRGESALWLPAVLARATAPSAALAGVPAPESSVGAEWQLLLNLLKAKG